MKVKLSKIHTRALALFDTLTLLLLHGIAYTLGFASLWLPVLKIWTSIADKKFDLLLSIAYVLIGVVCFYFAIALNNLLEKVEKEV